jgi:hypothetical protein
VNQLHDYIEIEVSASCPAHNPQEKSVNYEIYTRLRREYFVGRKRMPDDNKVLRAEEYTLEQQEAIKQARIELKYAMHRSMVARAEWRHLLKHSGVGTAVNVARMVNKARYERNEARRAVRAADLKHRMAWELPVLLGHHQRQVEPQVREIVEQNGRKFLPYRPGMTVTMLGGPLTYDYAAEYAKRDVEHGLSLAQALNPKKPRRRLTTLHEHLRKA